MTHGFGYQPDYQPDQRDVAATQRRLEDLQQKVNDLEIERASMRERIMADIRTAAVNSDAANARLQAFNAEVTADMSGEEIKRLVRKHNL